VTPSDGRTTIEDLGGPWHPGSGQVARRTNLVIAALCQQQFNEFGPGALRDAVNHAADVHSQKAVGEYMSRVTEHGPFEQVGPARWRIQADPAVDEEPDYPGVDERHRGSNGLVVEVLSNGAVVVAGPDCVDPDDGVWLDREMQRDLAEVLDA
jgi:hypothetical protein